MKNRKIFTTGVLALFSISNALATTPKQSYEYWKGFFGDPKVVALIIAILFLIFALASINKAMNTIKEITLRATNPNYDAEQAAKPSEPSLMASLTDAVPIEKEGDIMLDHDYDGIKELDNNLPPWWLYGFYISIIWAIGYFAYFEIFGIGKTSGEAYEAEMAQAEEAVNQYLATAADLVDENTVTMLTDDARIKNGEKIFVQNCVACHLADGGGSVGPNLTDEYWKHGGGIQNVFKTIKYGVPEKGMISWKDELGASKIQDVASYVMTLQGTTPANPKAPEGEKWIEEKVETTSEEIQDSTVAEPTEE